MKKKALALISLILILSVLASAFATPAYAATYKTGANSVSSSYKGSKYYSNFQKVTLTGDGRTDVIAIALSQTGYLESNSSGSYAGTTAGSGNYTEYNYNMGDWGSGYAYEWCASFCSWALLQSGCTTQNTMGAWCRNYKYTNSAYIWREVGCAHWADQLRYYGYFKYSKQNGGSYAPQTGDLIFFDWAGGSSGEDHIGLVVYSDSSYVYTIEGNTSDQAGLVSAGGGVFFKKYSLGYGYITGYGVLPYKTNSAALDIDYSGNNPTPGYFVSAGGTVSVYSTETATSASYTMPRFTMFEVTQVCSGGRLKVKYTSGSTEIVGYIAKAPGSIVQFTASQQDGLGDALAAAEAIYFGDYSESILAQIRTSYDEGKALLASTTSTFATRKACAEKLTALIARKGEGTPVGDAVAVTTFNKKITTSDCNVFTPSFGTITGDTANHKWTTNIVAKWSADRNAYVITAKTTGSGATTPDISLASDEILIATHYGETTVSIANHGFVTAAKVGDIITFYGCTPASNTISVASYFTIEEGFDDGDVTEDGMISTNDYLAVKQYVNGTRSLTEAQQKRADLNKDGMVSSVDIIAIRNLLVG